jgi:hypothetical protein
VRVAIKKIGSLLCILLGFTPLLFVVCFELEQDRIKYNMKEKLKIETTITIAIPENEVIWVEEDEIYFENTMFDIKSFSLENGIYKFTGYFDIDETLLMQKHEQATGKRKAENKLLTQLFKCFQNYYSKSQQDVFVISVETTDPAYQVERKLPWPLRHVPTPPPQC